MQEWDPPSNFANVGYRMALLSCAPVRPETEQYGDCVDSGGSRSRYQYGLHQVAIVRDDAWMKRFWKKVEKRALPRWIYRPQA